jgi:hypothetical protein
MSFTAAGGLINFPPGESDTLFRCCISASGGRAGETAFRVLFSILFKKAKKIFLQLFV